MGYLIISLLVLISSIITVAFYIAIPGVIIGSLIDVFYDEDKFQIAYLWMLLSFIVISFIMTGITAYLISIQNILNPKANQ